MSGPSAGGGGLAGFRVGQGFDVHRFCAVPGRTLVLGGLEIEAVPGLEGHSDADVVCHALADALLGASGLGDLGEHFPDSDPKWVGARSVDMLEAVLEMLRGRGLAVQNADCTIICERPRLAELTPQMASRLSSLLDAPVSVKAKRAEGMGAIGRVEGIACLVVALVAPA